MPCRGPPVARESFSIRFSRIAERSHACGRSGNRRSGPESIRPARAETRSATRCSAGLWHRTPGRPRGNRRNRRRSGKIDADRDDLSRPRHWPQATGAPQWLLSTSAAPARAKWRSKTPWCPPRSGILRQSGAWACRPERFRSVFLRTADAHLSRLCRPPMMPSPSHLSRSSPCWIESGSSPPRASTEIYLARLERFDKQLHCIVTLTRHVLAQARAADAEIAAGKYRGPLHGIPWGAKDLLDIAGILTTYGAEPFRNRIPTEKTPQ